MDENTNLNAVNSGADTNTATDTDSNNNEMLSITQSDLDKKIQSAEDKVRRELSEKNKKLEAEIIKLSPTKKTEAEIELENKVSALELKQAEIDAKEKDLALRASLQENNIDKSIADFVKTDVDVKALCTAIDKVVNARIAAQGYVPSNGHVNNTGMTPEEWKNLKYSEQVKIYNTNPELAKRFFAKK